MGTEIMMVSRKPMHIRNGCNVNMDDGFSKSIHGNNADKLRWDILWAQGDAGFLLWWSGPAATAVVCKTTTLETREFESRLHHFT